MHFDSTGDLHLMLHALRINGLPVTSVEHLTMRLALAQFQKLIEEDGLGDDDMEEDYLKACKSLLEKLGE